MILGLYAVRDLKSGYQAPTCADNDAIAARMFGNAVQQGDSMLMNYAKDFALFRLGDYDTSTGRVEMLDLPCLILEAVDVLKGKE